MRHDNMMESERHYLLVDDEIFRIRLQRALSERAYSVSGASGCEEALEVLRSVNITHIVLDLNLGQETGLDLLAKLCELQSIKDVKVLMLTGYGSIATAVEAMGFGCVSYLTKLVGVSKILQAFDDVDLHSSLDTEPASLDEIEWEHLQRVLMDHESNIGRAARALGLHRRSLQRKLVRHKERLEILSRKNVQ